MMTSTPVIICIVVYSLQPQLFIALFII